MFGCIEGYYRREGVNAPRVEDAEASLEFYGRRAQARAFRVNSDTRPLITRRETKRWPALPSNFSKRLLMHLNLIKAYYEQAGQVSLPLTIKEQP
jgi:hypothetical protein